VVTSEQGDVTK